MKIYFIHLVFMVLLSASCQAQTVPLSLREGNVKSQQGIYSVKKEDRYIQIESTSNKLGSVKSIAPNLPLQLHTTPIMYIDHKHLAEIFQSVVPANKIEKLPKGMTDGLSIRIRLNLEGVPQEMSFLTGPQSILTLEELAQLEKTIKEKIRGTYPSYVKKEYMEGANFIVVDVIIYYDVFKK